MTNKPKHDDWTASVHELYESAPIAFRRKPYISVDVGWHSLLEEFAHKLEKLIARSNESHEDIPYVFDVKEKYGSLRIAVYGGFTSEDLGDELHNLVNEYEDLSSTICEKCGSVGKPTNGGWIKTLCQKHSEERSRGRI